jgi:glycopeptide antibiotics resistance protein
VKDGGRRAGTVLAVLLVVAVGALLLWPNGEGVRRLLLDVYLFGLERGVPARVGPEVYATLLNVMAFVPLGWLGVAALHRRVPVVAATLLGASVVVELVQALPVMGRDPSVVDVACNAVGGLLGALLASAVLARRPEHDDPGVDQAGDEPLDPGPDVRG